MHCSLCLNKIYECKKIIDSDIEVPCSHHICFNCAPRPKNMFSNQIRYQCDTCLAVHDLRLDEFKKEKQRGNRFQLQSSFRQNLYCWTCSEEVNISEHLHGSHQGHHISTLSDANPTLKNKLLARLQIGQALHEHLQTQKDNLIHNDLQNQYQDQISKIELFFEEQMQILAHKRDEILREIEREYNRCIQSVQTQLKKLRPSLDQVKKGNSIMKQYLENKITINELRESIDLSNASSEGLLNLRKKQYKLPILPFFIQRSNISVAVDLCCTVSPGKVSVQQNLNDHFKMSNQSCQSRQKVRLVDKLKNRFHMKSSDSLAMTGISFY